MTSSESGGAVISGCGKYRYTLDRQWGYNGLKPVLWVMLNPSTADANEDDPTIRRVRGFSKAWGYDGFTVVNLYAYRATSPVMLKMAEDPVGPDNDESIRMAAANAARVVCAWGQPGPQRERASRVLQMLSEISGTLYMLRQNENGQPAHPLYLPKSLTLEKVPE